MPQGWQPWGFRPSWCQLQALASCQCRPQEATVKGTRAVAPGVVDMWSISAGIRCFRLTLNHRRLTLSPCFRLTLNHCSGPKASLLLRT